MQIKPTLSYHFTRYNGSNLKDVTRAGEDVEKAEPSYAAGENVKWSSYFWKTVWNRTPDTCYQKKKNKKNKKNKTKQNKKKEPYKYEATWKKPFTKDHMLYDSIYNQSLDKWIYRDRK